MKRWLGFKFDTYTGWNFEHWLSFFVYGAQGVRVLQYVRYVHT